MTLATTRTICPYCGVGCGVIASTQDKQGDSQNTGTLSIEGDVDHPSNHGRLCSKGADLAQTFQAPDRLLTPRIHGKDACWDEATRIIAEQFNQVIAQHGPEAVAFYVSGQLLTEDYYVVNKLVKGWLGTANIDTNSRLCMASSVTGHKRAFGSDTVPGCYADLEQADLLVLVGSNLAWCHPVLYQRIQAAREKRPEMKMIVIDPRRSATAEGADLHLAVKPDSDVLLFNALLVHLADTGQIDTDYVENHVNGFDQCMKAARATLQPATKRKDDLLSERLGITDDQLQQFLSLVERCEKTVTVYSQGVNQSVAGTDKVNAIINCHLASGRIGRPGMGPFSVTGQPNAMGGREVGGLATMLACHMDLNNPDHCRTVQRFWRSPAIADKPGLTAVELFDAVAKGKIKALWIMATNPVDSMPNADKVERALASCPFVVVSDVSSASDTVDKAHIALPAQPFGEKDGTVSNSERRVSRMRRFCKVRGEAKPDWWAICEVARRMGHEEAFSYGSVAEIFREYAALSGFENAGSRDFDISAYAALRDDQYDAMQPFQWPKPAGAAVSPSAEDTVSTSKPVRFFARGHFYTPDGKANMLSVGAAPSTGSLCLPESEKTLNTGRIRDQWHTMTRTGYSSRLMSHYAEPFVELNPELAERQGISTGDIVKVGSAQGHALLRASVSDRQRPTDVFVPMHWNRKFASRARIDAVVDDRVDPVSRQPAFKNQVVSVTRFPANSFAYVLSNASFDVAKCHGIEYWAKAPVSGGWQMELAGSASPRVMLDTIVSHLMLDQAAEHASLRSVEYSNTQDHDYRIAFFINEQLVATVFVAREPVALSRSWAALLFSETNGSLTSRWQLLAGRPGNDVPVKGAIVCSCMMVGASEIQTAIVNDRCETVDAVGRLTGAGSQCGSCRNELQEMIKHSRSKAFKAAIV